MKYLALITGCGFILAGVVISAAEGQTPVPAVAETDQAAPATPAAPCAPRALALATLFRMFEEVPVATGLTTRGMALEVLISPGGKTWSILMTTMTGVTCLASHGTDWEYFEPESPGDDI